MMKSCDTSNLIVSMLHCVKHSELTCKLNINGLVTIQCMGCFLVVLIMHVYSDSMELCDETTSQE